eukprot:CAMPEP_0196585282 /NCGR_PEP_ID=MMETSP1081-20130531/50098_1 /TAXON_ID=36882 /ORGANISM="Pyramimonas amylifera, Strain CCMP720" /LENGTH=264 /DNA_ID=CAMNT_0041906771 /DNA_START=77 /DNA_END=870 /DNA_ORIENTATION=+
MARVVLKVPCSSNSCFATNAFSNSAFFTSKVDLLKRIFKLPKCKKYCFVEKHHTNCTLKDAKNSQQASRLTRSFSSVFESITKTQVGVEEVLEAGLGLNEYMLLPVNQYVNLELPMGAVMERVNLPTTEVEVGDPRLRFSLTIPSLKDPAVLVQSSGACLEGSWAEKLKLNERFEFEGVTKIIWQDVSSQDELGDAWICADTHVVVGVDPPKPFSSLPKGLIRRLGNAVIGGANEILQKVFVQKLVEDYQIWASSLENRISRKC